MECWLNGELDWEKHYSNTPIPLDPAIVRDYYLSGCKVNSENLAL
jgi:hypothetical protein